MSDIPAARVLPSKESTLFKELLTLYETRQLKKGLKTADLILKKFPKHGETTCMKGLVLTHMGRREEGVDLVRKGVQLDLSSHICWHVYGLIHKGEKNYKEALKCYTQALRYDKENLNILRDAAQLQTQLRIYDGLVETRHTLLKIRPAMRQHWIALAVAYHLNGNLQEAKQVLDLYEATLKNVPDRDVEHSETMLYHVRLLEELGEFTEALAMLDVNAKSRAIVDRTAIMEIRARLLTKLGSDEAEHAWRVLVEHNAESYEYYQGYLSNLGLTLDAAGPTAPQSLAVLQEFSTQIPRATAPRRLALTIASGEQFRELVKPYLLSGLKKGVPSLFSDIKGLYHDQAKQQIIEEVALDARDQFSFAEPSSSAAEVEPTSYLWTLYFLAQHHSSLGRHAQALEILDAALAHTPTLPELHMIKGRVLKRAGDLYGGARCQEDARFLDGQDRFLNTKSAKYRLRAGMVEEASALLGLFTKKDAATPGADLEDMQSLLYLVEEADAHKRNGDLGPALKKYMAVNKVFDDFEDDQYDFHGYSLRKFTISIYLNLLTWEDRVRSHPAYIKSALAASRIFVAVHDDPSIATAATATGQLTGAQKKAKQKAKKAAQKAQEDAKKAAAQANNNDDKGLEPAHKDDDPDGTKLLQCTDPLERAASLLKPLATFADKNIDVLIATYDVAVRRKKYLQASKALALAAALDTEHPELHIRRVEFRQTVSSLAEPPQVLGPILTESSAKLLPDEVSLETFNSQYLQRHSASAPAILAVAKVLVKLQTPREQVEETLFTALDGSASLDIKTALAILAFLRTIQSPREDEFRTQSGEKFELSTVFKPAAELAELRQLALKAPQAVPDNAEEIPEDAVPPASASKPLVK
ncbi:NMDA receptor-regulated protein 1-domain-containing protein [Mycena albidolilacea]|uniref:NMDA receptor-regulated protein 1-domain-containing protein n=1 Tax=Mycena albidolilacea TaxID=1033008 RepID=A0AAD6ZRP6_9AGAR|nr:NMDA receptor-regulated protein 1-domain-containing protein [Mycena albidolilacea]